MERIHTLIDKLHQQKTQAASPAQLLFTVQLLQHELSQLQKSTDNISTRKVAVTLPFNAAFSVPETLFQMPLAETVETETPAESKVVYALHMPDEEVMEEAEPMVVEAAKPTKEYTLRKPVLQDVFFEEPKPLANEEPAPLYSAQHLFSPAFETTIEVPTLAQYHTATEVNEKIAERKESLNDRLKREQTEVAQALKETPIKDLRKGIGINDRFAFVNELFRGDEAAYERSIKTINGFNIYSEAEYWMSRELKLKLGWDDKAETVQHFYGLVRRRFS